MKFQIVAALMGLSQGVQLKAGLKNREADKMHEICKNVHGIDYPHQSILVQLEESTLPIAEKKSSAPTPTATTTDTPKVEEPAKTADTTADKPAEEPDAAHKNIKGSYEEHYGKTKEEVDKENHEILSTQAKCLEFVKSHQGHPKVCEWCQNEYKRPEVVWKWNPDENTWYRWYDGNWHYWGPSKDGFTEGGWSWYNGHWHNDGYVFKYENGTWSRFEDHQWVPYGKEVPVDPSPPTGGKICRPFYKMMKQGFPQSLASTQVPRCKVGEHIYMWTDDAACNFLGGQKTFQERVVCKSGESHKWKRVVKCVVGQNKLPNGGFDYKTGKLNSTLYAFKQCQVYKTPAGAAKYLYLFGKMHMVPEDTMPNLFKSPLKVTSVTQTQLNSAQRGKGLKPGSTLVEAEGGAYFLNSYSMDQFESEEVFDTCHFDRAKVQKMTEKDFATKEIGDIITV